MIDEPAPWTPETTAYTTLGRGLHHHSQSLLVMSLFVPAAVVMHVLQLSWNPHASTDYPKILSGFALFCLVVAAVAQALGLAAQAQCFAITPWIPESRPTLVRGFHMLFLAPVFALLAEILTANLQVRRLINFELLGPGLMLSGYYASLWFYSHFLEEVAECHQDTAGMKSAGRATLVTLNATILQLMLTVVQETHGGTNLRRELWLPLLIVIVQTLLFVGVLASVMSTANAVSRFCFQSVRVAMEQPHEN